MTSRPQPQPSVSRPGAAALARLLFVHPNFPAQYRQLAPRLAAEGHEVGALTKHHASMPQLAGVTVHGYKPAPFPPMTTRFAPLEQFADSVRQGRAAQQKALQLLRDGYRPDVVIGHPGWGDMMFLDLVWPDAKQIAYMEFYYRHDGADAYFDPEFKPRPAERDFSALRNLNQVLAFERAAACVVPTEWQRSLFSTPLCERMDVIHEGVDTAKLAPDADARLVLPDGRILDRTQPVLTYSARNLEPYRGFHSFMRALPRVQDARPDIFTVIVGGNDTSYGRRPDAYADWKSAMLAELGNRLDLSRVWFADRLPFRDYLSVLQLSTVHIYLTYPFVLSWSLIEAMACGCAIVASDTSPVLEVLQDGTDARLVDFLDPPAIAAGILELAGDPGLREKLAANARRKAVDEFDIGTTALPRYQELIARVLAQAQT